MSIKSFTSIDSTVVEGRGTVLIVENDRDRKNGDWDDLYPEVIVDGWLHELKGVESYATVNVSKGTPIGLLVSGGVSK